jgi:hypothetical protein
MSRKRRGVQHEFAKRALQSKRTKRDGDSSVIKDEDLPTSTPDNPVAPPSLTFNFASGWGTLVPAVTEDRYAKVSLPLPTRRTAEPMVCYRGWRLVEDERGPALMSVTANVVWDGPILRADGPPSEIPPFHRSGTHGIYAYPSPNRLLEDDAAVWGEVEVFGRVIVHESGLRAENARIRRLLIRRPEVSIARQTGAMFFRMAWGTEKPKHKEIEATDEVLTKLAERYQCDVRWWGTPFTD